MNAPPNPPYRGVDWDDALERNERAIGLTSEGAFQAEGWLKSHAPATVLSLRVVTGLHRTMFENLFPDFAGRLRGPAPQYVPSDVEFGNFHGTRHMEVPAACDLLFRHSARLIAQLDGLRDTLPPDVFDREVLKAASYVHCELVRIHPFVNGNGRIARICINYFAWRYGFRPLIITRPKGEYLEANRTWLQLRVIDHMVDFLAPQWKRRLAV
jgi:fido (protein-threonine AMPylation protein)